MLEDLLDQRAELRRTGQVGAVARDIDAGEHDLAIAVGEEAAHVLDDRAHRHRARIAAAVRDDAEGAAVVAAVLHLDEGAGVALERLDQMRAGLLDRHDVVDDRLRRVIDAERGARVGPGGGAELFRVTEDAIGLGHGGEGLRLGLRRAAGDYDLRLRILAAQRPDGLPRLAHCFRRDRAGVDHHRVGDTGALRLAADHFRTRRR